MISRRRLIESGASWAAAALALHVVPARAFESRQPFSTDAARLRQRLESLSRFGRPPGGTFADGVSRVGYSAADVEGRRFVMQLMRDAGLTPRVDPAGNIFARRPGRQTGAPPILVGSHIDSVPNGGNFDGDLGVLAALEVVEALNANGAMTRHPVDVVVWANEEGVAYGNGLDGSRAAVGERAPNDLDLVWNGVRKADAIRAIGGDPERLAEARIAPGALRGYLELHIEQGGTLDRLGIPVGVVEGIVAIDRYEAVISGTPNHAGTTPMPMRQDALVAAARLILEVREVVTAEAGRQVGTVGQLAVSPNAPNVVPGSVRHTIELRDLSAEKIARLAETIRGRAAAIARETGTEIAITRTSHHAAAMADAGIRAAIETAADRLGLARSSLPSGAGHDAQMMAKIAPMGMIFVPSVGGVSHSPRELTQWADCARGADVLLHAVLEVDKA